MPRLHLIHVARIQVVSTCIPCRRLRVSCIGGKMVVMATCIHLYLRVEHCLELVSVYDYDCIRRHVDGYKLLVQDTCIRLHDCIWFKRGLTLRHCSTTSSSTGVWTRTEGACYSKPSPAPLATSPLAGPVQDMLLNAFDPSWQLSRVPEEHRPICCCQPTSSWSPVSTLNRLRVAALTDQVRRACFLIRRSVRVERTAWRHPCHIRLCRF